MVEGKARALVCGGRDFEDRELAFSALDRVHESHGIALVIHGGASEGTDSIASEWAMLRGVRVQVFKLEGGRHGFGGAKRNEQMIADGKPDLAVAFPGGSLARDLVRQLRAVGIEVIEAHQAVARAS